MMLFLFFCCSMPEAAIPQSAKCSESFSQDPLAFIQNISTQTQTQKFTHKDLKKDILKKALKAYQKALTQNKTKSCLLTVIDYSIHSKHKRLWTINLSTQALVFHEWVSHGVGSDPDKNGQMDQSSNTLNSNMTSIGLFKTAETYQGKHGYSLRLDGLEKGFNDQARKRAIVIHKADYMNYTFINNRGRAGLSHGCPAVSTHISEQLINTIKGGSLIFAYYPTQSWLNTSTYLK